MSSGAPDRVQSIIDEETADIPKPPRAPTTPTTPPPSGTHLRKVDPAQFLGGDFLTAAPHEGPAEAERKQRITVAVENLMAIYCGLKINLGFIVNDAVHRARIGDRHLTTEEKFQATAGVLLEFSKGVEGYLYQGQTEFPDTPFGKFLVSQLGVFGRRHSDNLSEVQGGTGAVLAFYLAEHMMSVIPDNICSKEVLEAVLQAAVYPKIEKAGR